MTTGPIPGLADEHGRIGVLAIDHRDSLRAVIDPQNPASVARKQIIDLKRLILTELAPLATGVMLEPEYSIPDLVDVLPAGVGFTAALESQGYSSDPSSLPTEILEGWGVAQAKASGAAAAKLLAYYSPAAPDHAAQQRQIISDVVATCAEHDFPLLLEPLAFPADDRGPGTVAAIRETLPLGATVIKAAWPGESYLNELVDALQDRPWVLLSGGVAFEGYLDQVAAAVEVGASGFMAGRAVWREVTTVAGEAQLEFLRGEASERLRRLRSVLA